MNWTNLWMKLFGTTRLFGIDMGFWISLCFCILIVIAMNIIFWSRKPIKSE